MATGRGLHGWARSFLEASVFVTLISGLLVIIRLGTVSRGDVATAYVLISQSNPVSILVSTLLLVTPYAVLVVTAVVLAGTTVRILDFLSGPRDASLALRLAVRLFWTAVVLTLTTVLTFSSPVGMTIAVTIGLLAGVLARLARRIQPVLARFSTGISQNKWDVIGAALIIAGSTTLGVAMLIVFVVPVIPLDVPWSPSEFITFSEEAPTVARVVGQENGWLTLLVDNPRELIVVRDSDVVNREVCQTADLSEWENSLTTGWRTDVVTLVHRSCEDLLRAG